MAVTRRSTEDLASEVKSLLNRPDIDQLVAYPDAYYSALSRAHRYCRNLIIQHAPAVLIEETTVTGSSDGSSYDLADNWHFLEVWTPPGPTQGTRIMPALPESPYFGFYPQGTTLKLTIPKTYSPGLYIRWIPATVQSLSETVNHTLPAFCEDWLALRAAYEIASTPGVLADPQTFLDRARNEWNGDPSNPGEGGLLATLKRSHENAGFESAAGMASLPWWQRIG